MILLTGATGYLGSQIAHAIIARKMPLRVLVRDPARLPFDPTASGCEVITGDLTDLAVLRTALNGAEFLIHTAALVKMWVRNPREFWRINVAGFQNLLQTAVNSGVRRIIYTSSFIALGPSDYSSADESLVHPGPYSTEYEETKARALAWLRTQGGKYPVITLLPGVIYGPGPKTEGNLVDGMVDQYLAKKFPGLFGDGNQRWSFAYNADVVGAHVAALEKGQPGSAYVLAGDNRSLNDFFRVLAELTGVRRPVRHLPFWAGEIMGRMEVARARWFGHVPQLTPGVVEVFKYDWVYSSARAAAELDYRVTPLEEGLRKTLDNSEIK